MWPRNPALSECPSPRPGSWKSLGININCVLPGDMTSPGALHGHVPSEVREVMKDQPQALVTDPDDVARVLALTLHPGR